VPLGSIDRPSARFGRADAPARRGGEAQKQVANYSSQGMIADLTVVPPTADSPGQRGDTAEKVNEMLLSATGLPGTTDPVDESMPQPPSAAPSLEVSSTEVLITPQEVAFSTAAAAGVRRGSIGARLVASVRRVFAIPADASHPRPQHYPRRYGFLENALMAREMEKL
jgi:hypothetical protein